MSGRLPGVLALVGVLILVGFQILIGVLVPAADLFKSDALRHRSKGKSTTVYMGSVAQGYSGSDCLILVA